MGDFRKLEVWKLSCQLAGRVESFVDNLPPRARARYGDQLCRAANSIHENIAEGCGLNSDRQLAKYLRQALGSANETEDELLAMNRRGYMHDADRTMLDEIRRICAMLAGFIRKLESSPRAERREPSRTPRARAERREPSRTPRAEPNSRAERR